MQKRAPTLANILVIVLFALSCFGLLLFLWESFGGPVPLKPKGYRFTVELSRTLALAEQSEVRISGVDVGHVVGLTIHSTGVSDVTIEMNHQYAPIRASDHMILRQKTLLGETYVELRPPHTLAAGPTLPDGGRLASSQVEPAVTLDDILSALDPRTRAAFKVWQQSLAASYNGRGEQINSDFAEFEPFVEDANKLLNILASQEGAVRATIHNTGVVFDALTERDHDFRGFIVNGEKAFHALALSSRQFADAFRELPAFERGGTATLRELDSLAAAASPVLDEARGWERALTPLLRGVQGFTPDLNSLLTNLGPFTSASKKGLPAFEQALDLFTPLLANISPVLRNFDPFLQFTGEYVPELQSLFANVTAATEAHDKNSDTSNGQIQHYLRGLINVNPEGLAVYSKRIGTNRASPYFQPGAFRLVGNSGLQVFSTAACANSAPSVAGPANEAVSKEIIEQLVRNHVANAPESTTNEVGAPACTQQGPFTWEGVTGQYPHVTPPPPK
ncbi:MAG TPA: MlaD family protein [Solirubrobacteraceae bacterium]|jgi:phospholipid/cholesterol/gamma-HCH transport system substrate-binding protein|nr:MlaD family protein [Solirubrobacteraceae bacterium]